VCNGLKGLNSRVAVQAEQWGAATVKKNYELFPGWEGGREVVGWRI